MGTESYCCSPGATGAAWRMFGVGGAPDVGVLKPPAEVGVLGVAGLAF